MSQAVIGWLIAIVVFIVAEAATVALVSVWFIGGAVCALVAAILGAGLGVQLAVFSRRFGGAAGVRVPGGSKKVGKKAGAYECRPPRRRNGHGRGAHRRLRRYRSRKDQRRSLDSEMHNRRTRGSRTPCDHRAR